MHFFSSQKTRYSLPNCLSVFIVTILFLLLVTPANAYDIHFAWDPNSEPDLAGYVLYVDDGTTEMPYEYVDTYPLDDIDPNNPGAKMADLQNDIAYYFVVTAYDTEGNESYYSDEIGVMNGSVIGGSGGGGGGGGCFISTSIYSEKNKRELSNTLIFLLLMSLTIIGIIGLLKKNAYSAR